MHNIYLHANLKLPEQRRKVRLILNYYRTDPSLLRVIANEEGTEIFEEGAGLHFIYGYQAALQNLKPDEEQILETIQHIRDENFDLKEQLRDKENHND